MLEAIEAHLLNGVEKAVSAVVYGAGRVARFMLFPTTRVHSIHHDFICGLEGIAEIDDRAGSGFEFTDLLATRAIAQKATLNAFIATARIRKARRDHTRSPSSIELRRIRLDARGQQVDVHTLLWAQSPGKSNGETQVASLEELT